MRLLFHAVLIFGFFIGGDLVLNHGQWARALNVKAINVSKSFQREVNRLIE